VAKQHTYWLRDTIGAVPQLTGRVYVFGDVPSSVGTPYVVIHPADGVDEQDRLTGPSSLMNPRFTVHTVGLRYAEVADLSGLIKDQLIENGFGVVPVIVGERSHRVWYESPMSIQRDDDTSPPRLYHVAECGFASQYVS
jgi:hypothetical protein